MGSVAQNRTRIINDDPDLKKKNRPVEPDWAATIAGRLNANLLDRVNGSVHNDWVGGILPPIRSRKHDAALDLVRQNERLIETRIDSSNRRRAEPSRHGSARYSPRPGTPTSVSCATSSSTAPCGVWRTPTIR